MYRILGFSIVLASALHLVARWLPSPSEIEVVPVSNTETRPEDWVVSGFSEDGLYPAVPALPSQGRLWGSWIRGDQSTGSLLSPWLPVPGEFSLWISGYPSRPGSSLVVRVRAAGGAVYSEVVTGNAGESWVLWTPSTVPTGEATEVQFAASDRAKDARGWFAFSEPVRVRRGAIGWPLARTWLALGAVWCFLLGPGLVWKAHRQALSLSLLPVPGFALLVALGLLLWVVRPPLLAHALATSILGVLVAVVGWHVPAISRWRWASDRQLMAIVLTVVVSVAGVARATYSRGGPGELFAGTTSRTLEYGDRSDSRIPFHVVQLVALQLPPHGRESLRLFAPYTFSARGPLAGLASAPVVVASGAAVSQLQPNEPWAIFDRQGFALFRICGMALSALALLGVYGLAAAIFSQRVATLATLLAAGSPFLIHEVYFTWPKLLASYFCLLSLYFIRDRGWLLAGSALGVAYLCHPGALLALPIALAFTLLDAGPDSTVSLAWLGSRLRDGRFWASSGLIVAGLAVFVAGWRLVNLRQFEQGRFVDYALMAYGRRAESLEEWLRLRADSLASTLVPMWAFFMGPKPGVPEGGVQRWMFQYWLSLPFGIGLLGLPAILRLGARLIRREPLQVLLLLALPLALFAAYWGATDTGMMREGLHVWFLVLLCLCAGQWDGNVRFAVALAFLLALRPLETSLMILWPTALHDHVGGDAVYLWSDIASLLTLLAAMFWIARETWRNFRPDPSVADEAAVGSEGALYVKVPM